MENERRINSEFDRIRTDVQGLRDRQTRLETVVENQGKELSKFDEKFKNINDKLDKILDLQSKVSNQVTANSVAQRWMWAAILGVGPLLTIFITATRFFLEISK